MQSEAQHPGDEKRLRHRVNRDIHRVEWERQKRDRPRNRREERERSIWRAERKIEDRHKDRARG